MAASPHHPTTPRRQRGMSLIVVLVMLAAIFAIVAFSARLSLLAERSARNDRDRQVAMQAAEAALGDAEIDIMGPNTAANSRTCALYSTSTLLFEAGCGATLSTSANASTRGLCDVNSGTTPLYKTVFADDSSANRKYVEYGEMTGRGGELTTAVGGGAGGLPAKPPRYIIELITYRLPGGRTGAQNRAFKVTALGFGLNPQTQVMLQSVIYKPGQVSGC